MALRTELSRRIALPAALAVGAAALPIATAGAGKVTTVELGTSYYAPAKQTIKQGDKVRFRWNPSLDMHDVTVKTGPQKFSSPLQAAGTYTRTFAKAGKYVLYCTQHEDMGMTLVVKKKRR
jgi:plastocyanin